MPKRIQPAKATPLEAQLMLALLVVSRDKRIECGGCDWLNPCPQCFAGQQAAFAMELPQFRAWRKHWKIVAKRRRKRKGATS